jgi:WD repeat-containing protein 19
LLVNNISLFFESKNDYYNAGKYLLLGAEKYPSANPQYAKALKYFLMCPPTDSAPIEAAIEVVGLAKSDKLTHQLIDFLMGETDGMPKVRAGLSIFFLYANPFACRVS